MKIIAFIMVAGYLLLIACHSTSSKDAVLDTIPGVYAAEWTTAFTVARDTILIEPAVTAGSSTYRITRRTGMLYLNKPQYKIAHWTGVFDQSNKTIVINHNGWILSFDTVTGEMKIGSTVYKKL